MEKATLSEAISVDAGGEAFIPVLLNLMYSSEELPVSAREAIFEKYGLMGSRAEKQFPVPLFRITGLPGDKEQSDCTSIGVKEYLAGIHYAVENVEFFHYVRKVLVWAGMCHNFCIGFPKEAQALDSFGVMNNFTNLRTLMIHIFALAGCAPRSAMKNGSICGMVMSTRVDYLTDEDEYVGALCVFKDRHFLIASTEQLKKPEVFEACGYSGLIPKSLIVNVAEKAAFEFCFVPCSTCSPRKKNIEYPSQAECKEMLESAQSSISCADIIPLVNEKT